MTTEPALTTAEELAALPDDGRRLELLDGVLHEMAPSNPLHNWYTGRLFARLFGFVEAYGLGFLMTNDTGIILRRNPDRVRAADICFFAAGRFPEGMPPEFYTEVIPDFVVETVSPSQTAAEIDEKIQEWIGAGVRMVWAVYPRTRSVTVYRGLDDVRVYREGETLDGAPVFPGFTLPVADIFS